MFILQRYCSGQFDPAVKVENKSNKCQKWYSFFATVTPISPQFHTGSHPLPWVMLDMTWGLRGHNITCDHFFTSYNLGQELLKRKLTMVGRVWKNRGELPAELLVTKNRAPESDTTAQESYWPIKRGNVVKMSWALKCCLCWDNLHQTSMTLHRNE